ncbi:TonB-dependent receptor [Oxalobacteraceae bacterium]|nr:TonB-dependent receptor [Oxalobacteraceae bacterium]
MMVETVLSRSVRLICAGGLAISTQLAFAQTTEQPVQRVEITGSAIKRIDAEKSVPVTIMKIDDLKKQGVTTVEQVLANLSVSQSQQGTSQVVGLGTGGASFADLRGIGQDKTLILLNGRRLANNSLDSSAPDLNMIPFAALQSVEVLRDGASSLYGSDAVGGVINFITKKDYTGFTGTVGIDSPQKKGGMSKSVNLGFGYGTLDKEGFNIFAMVDHQSQKSLKGTERDINKRYPGGLSPTTSPANYYQDGNSGNPSAPGCTAANLIPAASATDKTSCQMTTSSFVDYIPKSERTTGLIKGTIKLNNDHELGLEYLVSTSKVRSQIAPVPYGGLRQNRVLPNGTLNPFYPGNGTTPTNIPLDPNYTEDGTPASVLPGFIHVKWRDLPNGPRADDNKNDQQRFVATLSGQLAGWDYDSGLSFNENKVRENLMGYSNGALITEGVLNGVINPFGDQNAAGTALLNSAALDGTVQTAKGTTTTLDAHASRAVGDWLNAGQAMLAVGANASHEKFVNKANPEYAAKVVSSTGIDPDLHNEGSRSVYATFAELNVPLLKNLEVTGALRYDKYSDFGSTTNPKFSFKFTPTREVLLRGSYSTGFRAPSLYEINSAQTYGNTNQQDDPINCPGGTVIPGKPAAANCSQQFQKLSGGNKNLQPEKSKNATLGFVVEPISNLTMSVDFWWIRLEQAIGTLAEDDVFSDLATYGGIYHRNPAGNLATDGSQCPDPATCGYVDLRTQNLGGTNTNGFDYSLLYKLRSADLGTFNFGLNGTYVSKYEYQNTAIGEWHQNVGIFSGTGNIFRMQSTATLNWNKGVFGGGLTAHYKAGYTDAENPAFKGTGLHQVGTYTTFDAFGSWAGWKGLALTAGVRNLTNVAPPLSYQTQTFQAGYDPRYSDPLGRTYYLRATYSF